MATVELGTRIRDQPRPDWVQMRVSHELEKIAVRVDRDRLIAPLNQVSAAPLPSIYPPRVPKRKILDDGGKPNPPDLDEQVHLVGHPAVAMHVIAKAPDPLGVEGFELPVIRRTEENPLTPIAALDDVGDSAGDMHSRFPRHGWKAIRTVSQ